MFSDAYEDCNAQIPPGVQFFVAPCRDVSGPSILGKSYFPGFVQDTQAAYLPQPVNPTHYEPDTNSMVPMMVAAAGALLMLKG